MTALPALGADVFSRTPSALAEALHESGACWIAGWPNAVQVRALRDDLREVQAAAGLSPAAVGHHKDRHLRSDIRTDSTCWLDDTRCGEPARTFLAQLGDVRTMLNRSLFLGLDGVEAHYAAYPSGGGYARHRDRFHDSDARVVSWVTYLNADDWNQEDGGALRLHLKDVQIDVRPVAGSLCFLSELEHEVLPARRERFSIAAWFRRSADDRRR
jgi:SM-20-related protein